jgi:hypothetical protein
MTELGRPRPAGRSRRGLHSGVQPVFFFLPPPIAERQRELTWLWLLCIQAVSFLGSDIEELHSRWASPPQAARCADEKAAAGSGAKDEATRASPKIVAKAIVARFTDISFSSFLWGGWEGVTLKQQRKNTRRLCSPDSEINCCSLEIQSVQECSPSGARTLRPPHLASPPDCSAFHAACSCIAP